jgi:hypothetical protein
MFQVAIRQRIADVLFHFRITNCTVVISQAIPNSSSKSQFDKEYLILIFICHVAIQSERLNV